MTHVPARLSPAAPLAPLAPPGPLQELRERKRPRAGAFSLLEVTIVVLIIAILAAIAVRRLSRHTEQAEINAVAQDESTLQTAVERYRAEHGNYPKADQITAQLTQYTDVLGNVSATRVAPYVCGPYVRNIPPAVTGPARGSKKIGAAAASDVGWVYDPATGAISANAAP
jgi:prepilin-type N-terminal cleavage/methylation domain-containing protein